MRLESEFKRRIRMERIEQKENVKSIEESSSLVESLRSLVRSSVTKYFEFVFAYVCLSKTKVSVELFSSFFKRIAGNGRGIILK